MTADLRMVPISGQTAESLIILLGELQAYPALRFRAADLCKVLGEACQIAGEHRSECEMQLMELLESVGRATGRPISTVATLASVKAATDALEHTAPVLGTNVIALPRAPERETAASIDAAAAKAMLDSPGALSVRVWIDHNEREPYETWAAPVVGETMPTKDGKRARVYHVHRSGPNRFHAFALTLCSEGADSW